MIDKEFEIDIARGETKRIIAHLQRLSIETKPLDQDFIELLATLGRSPDELIGFWAKRVLARSGVPYSPFAPGKAAENALADELQISPGGRPGEDEQTTDLDILFKKLNSVKSSFIVMDTVRKILESRELAALSGLLDFLPTCSDPIVLSYLTKNLGMFFPREELLPILVPYLKHVDERIIANTIEGLEAIGSPKSVVEFSQLLKHSNHRVSANAAKALARFDRETASRILNQMLSRSDAPHLVIAACHAVRILRDPETLPCLEKIIQFANCRDDAIRAIVAIGGDEGACCLQRIDQKIMSDDQRCLIHSFFRQLGLKVTSGAQENPFQITVLDRRIFVLPSEVTQTIAEDLAAKHRQQAFGWFLSRPNPNDVEVRFGELRYTPLWYATYVVSRQFTRHRELPITFSPEVVAFEICGRDVPIRHERAVIKGAETCRHETKGISFLNGLTGSALNPEDSLKFKCFEPDDILDLEVNGQVVVLPNITASAIIRGIIVEALKPIMASEIISESIVIEHLHLYFRPSYVFELCWVKRNQRVIIEIDGIKGKVGLGNELHSVPMGRKSIEEVSDIGGELLGVFIPGANVARRLIRFGMKLADQKGS